MEELKEKENLPEEPEYVQKYLDTKEHKSEGKFFRITIDQKSDPVSGHGIAYSNALRIEKRDGEAWTEVYNSGMREYRGAYAGDTDNWDLSLNNPTILEESEIEMIYALRTGGGNVKVYRFNEEHPENLVTFDIDDYKKTQKRIELLQKIIDDDKAFRDYVSAGLGTRWSVRDEEILVNGKIVVLLARHSDRGYDAITDAYQIHIWVKGKGVGISNGFFTGLHHPGGRFYYVGVGFSATVISEGKNFANINAKISNRSQDWKATHDLRVEWSENITDFEREAGETMEKITQSHQHNHPLYKPARITEKIVDEKRKIAVWILFEQIDTDRGSGDGEGWLGDQFRYSLWKMNGSSKSVQIYEDHAYIRPRSKSELTGTRGRDCTLKELKLEDKTIKVLYPKGEKVEEQEWEERTFSI